MAQKKAKKKTKKKTAKKKAAAKKKADPVVSGLPEIVKRDDLVLLFGVTSRRVNMLNDEGMPKVSPGKYSLIDCVQWYIDMWKKKATGNDDEKKNKQISLIDAQRDKIVLETEKLRENLVPIEEVAHALNSIGVIVSTQLDGLGARMANELAGLDDPAEIQRALFDECRQIRDNVAGQIDDLAATTNSGVDSPAAA